MTRQQSSHTSLTAKLSVCCTVSALSFILMSVSPWRWIHKQPFFGTGKDIWSNSKFVSYGISSILTPFVLFLIYVLSVYETEILIVTSFQLFAVVICAVNTGTFNDLPPQVLSPETDLRLRWEFAWASLSFLVAGFVFSLIVIGKRYCCGSSLPASTNLSNRNLSRTYSTSQRNTINTRNTRNSGTQFIPSSNPFSRFYSPPNRELSTTEILDAKTIRRRVKLRSVIAIVAVMANCAGCAPFYANFIVDRQRWSDYLIESSYFWEMDNQGKLCLINACVSVLLGNCLVFACRWSNDSVFFEVIILLLGVFSTASIGIFNFIPVLVDSRVNYYIFYWYFWVSYAGFVMYLVTVVFTVVILLRKLNE